MKLAKRIDLKSSHQQKRVNRWGDEYILISLSVVVSSQCICLSNHQFVYLRYMQFLFINHISIMRKKDKKQLTIKMLHLIVSPEVFSCLENYCLLLKDKCSYVNLNVKFYWTSLSLVYSKIVGLDKWTPQSPISKRHNSVLLCSDLSKLIFSTP